MHKPAMPTGRSDSTREEHEPTSALLWDEAVGARSLPPTSQHRNPEHPGDDRELSP